MPAYLDLGWIVEDESETKVGHPGGLGRKAKAALASYKERDTRRKLRAKLADRPDNPLARSIDSPARPRSNRTKAERIKQAIQDFHAQRKARAELKGRSDHPDDFVRVGADPGDQRTHVTKVTPPSKAEHDKALADFMRPFEKTKAGSRRPRAA